MVSKAIFNGVNIQRFVYSKRLSDRRIKKRIIMSCKFNMNQLEK